MTRTEQQIINRRIFLDLERVEKALKALEEANIKRFKETDKYYSLCCIDVMASHFIKSVKALELKEESREENWKFKILLSYNSAIEEVLTLEHNEAKIKNNDIFSEVSYLKYAIMDLLIDIL